MINRPASGVKGSIGNPEDDGSHGNAGNREIVGSHGTDGNRENVGNHDNGGHGIYDNKRFMHACTTVVGAPVTVSSYL